VIYQHRRNASAGVAPSSLLAGEIAANTSDCVLYVGTGSTVASVKPLLSATDRLLGRSSPSAGPAEEITCTAAGRALLDDADAATQLTTLGAAPAASPTFTGVVSIADGTKALPSLTFSADTDTGLFRNAANVLALAAGGNEIVRVGINGVTVNQYQVATETALSGTTTNVPVLQIAQRAAAQYATYVHGYHSGQSTGVFLSGYNADVGMLSCGMSLQSTSGLYPTGTVTYKSHRTKAASIELNDGNVVFRQTTAGTADNASIAYSGVTNVTFASEAGGSVAIMGVDPAPARLAAGTAAPTSHLYLLRDDATIGTGPKLTFATRYTVAANYVANGYLQFKRTAGAGSTAQATTADFVVATGDYISSAYTYVERIIVNGLTGALGVNGAGTAAAPALYVGGDIDTGLFSQAANVLGLATGGTERGRITSSGVWIIGSGEAGATPAGNTLRAPDAAGTNIAGGTLTITPGNGTGTGGSGSVVFSTAPAGASSSTANTMTERLRIDALGNVRINGAAAATSAAGAIHIKNGTAPTASITDGVVLFAADVSTSSELRVRDEAGNTTTLSPHRFDLIPGGPSEPMAWAYYSERDGHRINVDMLRLARLVESLTGEKLVYEEAPA
jgi:hypothetical protein